MNYGSHAKNKQIIATKLESMDGKNWEFIFLFSIWNFVDFILPQYLWEGVSQKKKFSSVL